ncbi:hypothetical protein SAMN04488531_0557 [Corynebacterium coyleae]|nr:hypothetical protein HMPREF2785_07330 [Corynebacterium sp. HMSC067D03]OFO33915.1 hypothetical protein HMPREF3048_09940 [Corynebacterium sp. HMSC075D04]OHO31556.1 hypothetical protein HMPREF2656_09240 [Corynebacterium sp. HMSC034B08]OHO80010.1 hypothetical protein HMPREF2736_08315 [Corynebacterium sp. HMSC036E10]OHQ55804.1 hypothetical protein HMPREF2617_05825 [Corynebacterium sp. HMSC070H05]WJY80552.1 hypothetical protein CCOY_09865 [Corynebacterium coyleae]
MIYVVFGAVVALFISLCIMAIGYLVHLSAKRKVLSPYRFLVVMVLLAPVFLIYDIRSDEMCSGLFNYAVSGYLITAVIISSLWRSIADGLSEARE